MSAEITYLVWTAAFTGVMWIPYVLDRMMVRGIGDTVGYPENPRPQSGWAQRMKAAHANAVENLVVFAALVLAAQAAGVSNSTVAFACALYFWSRVVHFFVYAFAIPWLRTLAFAGGFVGQAIIAWQLIVH